MSDRSLKSRIVGALPRPVVSLIDRVRFRGKTPEDIFTDVYQKNKWGGTPGEFNSGAGSTEGSVTGPYVEMVRTLAESEGLRGQRFVDLGCGDFRVGAQLAELASHYIGVDVVRALVEHNRATHGSERVAFVQADIVADALPAGDVCFVRQVFQHLSNAQIRTVLPKLAAYSAVLVTEHLPAEADRAAPNVDKFHGADIRLTRSSGVYLGEPPFSVPAHQLRTVLDVPYQGGLIRTTLYRPGT